MTEQFVFSKLITALQDLTDSDLRQLAEVLRHPLTASSLPRLIREILALRQAERQTRAKESKRSNSTAAQPSNEHPLSREQSKPSVRSLDQIRRLLDGILKDKNLFPTTRDVVEAVNEDFGCRLDYAAFRKHGRAPIVQKCVGHLAQLQESERRRLLERFMARVPDRAREGNEYRELFRILTANE